MEKSADDRIKSIVLWVGFLAALTRVADYLETKWPKVAGMLNSVISLEGLNLLGWFLFIFAVGLSFWWLDKRMGTVNGAVTGQLEAFGERLRKAEGGKEPYVLLRPNEIIYPSPNGVLWAWNMETNAVVGPFCPRHRAGLFHKHSIGLIEEKDLDEEWLSSGWIFCPRDSEEFKFLERTVQVKKLRDEAAALLRSEMTKGS
jgi:hypothetical protein